MSALIVYESMYGNSRAIAEAIAAGIGDAEVHAVSRVPHDFHRHELLVVGGPTHAHGMTTERSRQAAAEADRAHLEPGATDGPGLRQWIAEIPRSCAGSAAVFDTRADHAAWLTGSAAHAIARRLRHRGYDVIAAESFLVSGNAGPLAGGELERARAWGEGLTRHAAGASGDRAPAGQEIAT
ncbi:MAG TPA: flavodoxin domain-containing protein [Solirubrobacteraceae bacterium]|nr:flavodoxin domain-containing protein [Solirubrobacteraceae bacterium]